MPSRPDQGSYLSESWEEGRGMPMMMGRIQREQRLWRGRQWPQRLVCRFGRMDLKGQAALRVQLVLHCPMSAIAVLGYPMRLWGDDCELVARGQESQNGQRTNMRRVGVCLGHAC